MTGKEVWGCDNYEDLYDEYPDESESPEKAEEFFESQQ